MAIQFTGDQVYAIEALSNEGRSIREVSRQTGISRRAIRDHLERAGLTINDPKAKSPERVEVERLLLEGVGPDEVSRMGLLSRAAVYKVHKALALIPLKQYRQVGKAEMAEAERLLLLGKSNREISRRTGRAWGTVSDMRERMGIAPVHNIGIKGVPQVIEALEARGHRVECMPHLHPFDLLVDGLRCELKCANLERRKVTDRFSFSLAGSASGAVPNDYVTVVNGVAFKDYSKTSDCLILAGFLEDKLTHIFRVSSDAIVYDQRILRVLLASEEHCSWLWYEVD